MLNTSSGFQIPCSTIRKITNRPNIFLLFVGFLQFLLLLQVVVSAHHALVNRHSTRFRQVPLLKVLVVEGALRDRGVNLHCWLILQVRGLLGRWERTRGVLLALLLLYLFGEVQAAVILCWLGRALDSSDHVSELLLGVVLLDSRKEFDVV